MFKLFILIFHLVYYLSHTFIYVFLKITIFSPATTASLFPHHFYLSTSCALLLISFSTLTVDASSSPWWCLYENRWRLSMGTDRKLTLPIARSHQLPIAMSTVLICAWIFVTWVSTVCTWNYSCCGVMHVTYFPWSENSFSREISLLPLDLSIPSFQRIPELWGKKFSYSLYIKYCVSI